MEKNTTPSQLHDPVYNAVTIVNSDASNYKTVIAVTGSDKSQETHVYSLKIISDDTVNRDILFAIDDGTLTIEEGAITVAASTGFTVASPPIQVVANRTTPALSRVFRDGRGNWFVALRSGETLKAKSLTTVTAAKTITIAMFGWKFTRTS